MGERAGLEPTKPWLSMGRLSRQRLGREERLAAAGALCLGVAWLVYTRLYFWLQPRGLTWAPSLFMHLTGRPDPFCGLTRTFAWMWRGDPPQAIAVYPLGPLVFALSFPALACAAAVLLTGQAVRLQVPPGLGRRILIMAASALALNWASKLIWLGM